MILNLTQHAATPSQIEQGVVDLPALDRERLCEALTITEDELAVAGDELFQQLIDSRVSSIVGLIWAQIMKAHQERTALVHELHQQGDTFDAWNTSRGPLLTAMIGGQPNLMDALKARLIGMGIKPVYSTSVRKSVEKHLPDGTVTKTQVFEHLKFRPAR
jgi:hypothetical protein